jgi:phosphoribosyl-AMP cyclohydrolase
MTTDWLEQIKWTEDGLVPVIAQEESSGKVLMLAWMNRESLELSVKEGKAIYWSRSRQRLWRKGEESGNTQKIREIRLDCDNDVILIKVEQSGGIACHTGRHNCFYQRLENGNWVTVDPVIKDPATIYK